MANVYKKISPLLMSIDHRYQRQLDEPRVRKIVKTFREELLGLFVVADRGDNTYFVIDGQHRWAALMEREYTDEVLCQVLPMPQLSHEADLFLGLQDNRKSIGIYDRFQARIIAKEPQAMAIVAILEAEGLEWSRGVGNRSVCAVSALDYAYQKGNLQEALRIITKWSGFQNHNCQDGLLIRAISDFLLEYPEASHSDLVRRLRRDMTNTTEPLLLIGSIKALKEAMSRHQKMSMREASIAVLVGIYNRRRSSGKLTYPKPKDEQ